MLILTRKVGEGIRIGADISLVIKEVRGRQVRVAIEAPSTMPVFREELYAAITEANRATVMPEDLPERLLHRIGGPGAKATQKP